MRVERILCLVRPGVVPLSSGCHASTSAPTYRRASCVTVPEGDDNAQPDQSPGLFLWGYCWVAVAAFLVVSLPLYPSIPRVRFAFYLWRVCPQNATKPLYHSSDKSLRPALIYTIHSPKHIGVNNTHLHL